MLDNWYDPAMYEHLNFVFKMFLASQDDISLMMMSNDYDLLLRNFADYLKEFYLQGKVI